eukprot:scaffold37596_cov40-Tisochrysis_lutea.AAC.2
MGQGHQGLEANHVTKYKRKSSMPDVLDIGSCGTGPLRTVLRTDFASAKPDGLYIAMPSSI